MVKQSSPYKLGKKLKAIRINQGFSQEDIAKMLNISRSSVVQIEKGNRQISAIELAMLSEALGFSMDRFLSSGYEGSGSVNIAEEPDVETEMKLERDAVPKLRKAKLETVILYITGKCGALPRMDVNLLISLLYFCDFDHYELHEEQLTGLSYSKQTFGPSPEIITEILSEMEKVHKLHRFKTHYNGFPIIKYLPGIEANLLIISAAEKMVIDQVLEKFSHWPVRALQAYSREEIPYQATKQGELINYELAFYRKPPHSVRMYDEDWSEL